VLEESPQPTKLIQIICAKCIFLLSNSLNIFLLNKMVFIQRKMTHLSKLKQHTDYNSNLTFGIRKWYDIICVEDEIIWINC